MAANDRQPGGTHYKDRAIQPWDFIASNNLDFFQGNIIKYVVRWREKGGIQDLQKAMHYLEKYIETQTPPPVRIDAASQPPMPMFAGQTPTVVCRLPGVVSPDDEVLRMRAGDGVE